MISRVLAVVLAAFAIGAGLVALILIALSSSADLPATYGFRGDTVLFALTCVSVGVAIAFRRPRNVIPWLFLVSGVSGGLYELARAYADYAVVVRAGAIPGGEWAGWISSWTWIPTTTVIPMYLPLVFPDGRLQSERWRPVALAIALAIVGFIVAVALVPYDVQTVRDGVSPFAPGIRNPISPFAPGQFTFADVQAWVSIPLLLALAASVTALVRRFRASQGEERLQMKWITYAIAVIGLITAGVPLLQDWRPFQIVNVLSINAAPIAAGIAILRYRLYDIDLLIHRTFVYGLTTVTLGAAFFAAIVLLQALLAPFTAGNELAVAASTLVLFALFQPVRRRVQSTVDRRFYRSRYDAVRTLDRFTSDLAGEVDLGAVRASLIEAVGDTVQPTHASVWLR